MSPMMTFVACPPMPYDADGGESALMPSVDDQAGGSAGIGFARQFAAAERGSIDVAVPRVMVRRFLRSPWR